MLIQQAVTLCLALCIFSLQAEYSHGESENNIHSVTIDETSNNQFDMNRLWQEFGCKTSGKPYAKMELCLTTMVNQLILRILQNYSPTPLPERLIITEKSNGFEDPIRKYIAIYLPQVSADEEKLQQIFNQINEYILNPLIKYMDQFPMNMPAPDEQAAFDSRREDITNILKKYMREPLNPVVPIVPGSFQENLPAIMRYLNRYAPDMTENLDVLTLLLYRIKKDGFKEIRARDLSALPKEEYKQIVSQISALLNQYRKAEDQFDIVIPYFIHDFPSFKPWLFRHFKTFIPELFANTPLRENVLKQIEEIFEGIEPNRSTPDTINGLDKTALLQFVKKYYPEQFGDQVFIDELVQNYDAQPKSTVTLTSEQDNNQIKNALLYFFQKVYPKLVIDEQYAEQFAENYKPDRWNNIIPTVVVPGSETISPASEEILEYAQKELSESTTDINSNGEMKIINVNVPATSSVLEAEFIPVPSRRIIIEHLSEQPTADLPLGRNDEPEPTIAADTAESAQDPSPSERKTIREKILECIKESFPHIYANKHALREILKQLENNPELGNEEAPMSLEKQIRKFNKKHVPKTIVDQSDGALNKQEDKVIEIDISPEAKHSTRTVEKIYIVKGNTNGTATVSVSNTKPVANAVNPEEKVIEIDITPETKHSSKTVEKVYIVEGKGSTAKVSVTNGKSNHNAVVNFEVSSKSFRKSNAPNNKLPNNINFKSNNAFAKISKEHAEQQKKEYMKILKNFQDTALHNKQIFKHHEIEMSKLKNMKINGKPQPTANIYERLNDYFSRTDNGKSGTIQFPYEHNFSSLIISLYGPLYEKEHKGKSLTAEERTKMDVLEKMFATNQGFRQLYQKKFGPQDKPDLKTMLYNMYKLNVKERQQTTDTFNDKLIEYIGKPINEKLLPPMKFPYQHNFFSLLINLYGTLFEKEQNGGSLTEQERTNMKAIEKMCETNELFRELYEKKFGSHDKLDVKTRLYNMYKMELKERQQKIDMYINKMKDFINYTDKDKSHSVQFPYKHKLLPLMIHSYGPLYEKVHKGESLAKQEQTKMDIVEKIFAANQAFQQLYQKKFGPQDKADIKTQLYNMYRQEIKENGGQLFQTDPMIDVKFQTMEHPHFEFVVDEKTIKNPTKTT